MKKVEHNFRAALALLSVLAGLLLVSAQARAAAPCCAITAVDSRTGVVTARVNASGQMFTFQLANRALLPRLRTGQPVFANFGGRQVSLDGKTIAGRILAIAPPVAARRMPAPALKPDAPAAISPGPRSPASAPEPSIAPPSGGLLAGGVPRMPISLALPQISAGPPQPVTGATRTIHRVMLNNNLVHLRGIEAIQQATNVPQGVRDFLFLHARALPPDQVDNYIVNVPLAEQWLKNHPEPEAVKKAFAGHNSHAGCHALSVHCAEEAAKHAEGEADRQAGKLLHAAQDEWRHVTAEAAHDWGQVQGCFADNSLHLANIPVQFSLKPEIPLSFEKNGNSKNQHGSVSGDLRGSVTFGIPVDANFRANVDVFYIPCLPFVVRPRSISASGVMGVGSTFAANLAATGQFTEEFIIPPSGGPHFPIYVVPIVIAGVPVAELDVSLYIDGRLNVDGKGSFNGDLKLEASQKTSFDFGCDGGGCRSQVHPIPTPATATESVKVDGRIHVKPSIYTALQLDFDVDLLSARVGPQPYLLGEIYGCAAASGAQNTSGQTSGQQSYALTADLDWGIDLLGEALVGNKRVGKEMRLTLKRPDHLYFADLAHSTALLPAIAEIGRPSPGKPAAFQLKMPACYPYPDQVEYQLKWTAGAAPVPANAGNKVARGGFPVFANGRSGAPSNCNLQSGQGECWGDPFRDTAFDLVWPQPGTYSLAVAPVRDKHGRKFDPPPVSQISVSVQ